MALYSIWVLEYAYTNVFPKTGVLYGAHNQGSLKLAYCYTVIKGNGHVAMQDVGYNNADYAKEFAGSLGLEKWQSHMSKALGSKPLSASVGSMVAPHSVRRCGWRLG